MKQSEYWNGEAAAVWAAHSDQLDVALGPLGHAAMAALAPATGEGVLDVGCGAGATSRLLAERVGAGGRVLGVDVSGPLVELARSRGGPPSYLLADAATAEFPGAPFDCAFSRFGVMFFEEPTQALAHLRSALRAGGRFAFICWRSMAENPWAVDVLAVALPFLKEPPTAPPPHAPGPFAFADAARLRDILSSAGWSAVSIAPFDTDYTLGATPEHAVEVSLRIGPLGRLIREQGLDPAPIRTALTSLLAGHVRAGGSVAMRAACWIVTARA